MKRFLILSALISLSACGTIGIGSNHETKIYNNSNNTIIVSADSGVYKIKPEQDMTVYSNNDLAIKSANANCPETSVVRKANTAAIILDVFPIGWLLFPIPILVDAVSNNMYKMPSTYSYSCAE